MRILSLLPAATEIVVALGQVDSLVGISHECDYPPSVLHLPRVTTTSIDPNAPSRVIDLEIRRLRESGRPVIGIDRALLLDLMPDVILTQSLCDVCAVSDGEVEELSAALPRGAAVLRLSGTDVAGIWRDIKVIGDMLDAGDEAEEIVLGLECQLRKLTAAGPIPTPRAVCVEWVDPLYLAGHWVPELVAAAGGVDVGATPGSSSRRVTWAEIRALRPDVVLVMLCGFGVERSKREWESLTHDREAPWGSCRVAFIDGNAFTSRPGPRIVEGAAFIQRAFQGEPKDN